MGESKRRKQRTTKFLINHPVCCYCGGMTAAETRDHVPPRNMFLSKKRPKGLEVPACAPCNKSTGRDELVAAMFGRLFPDSSSETEKAEVRQLMRDAHENIPRLFEELEPSLDQLQRAKRSKFKLPDGAGVLDCTGPILNRSIQAFGAKLGFAFHYHHTGRIVPPDGGVAVRWYSNIESLNEEIPESILDLVGPPQTLRQGKWEVSDQFSCASAIADTGKVSAFFSTFRFSFAVLSWVTESISSVEPPEDIFFHQPGCFLAPSEQDHA